MERGLLSYLGLIFWSFDDVVFDTSTAFGVKTVGEHLGNEANRKDNGIEESEVKFGTQHLPDSIY